MTRKLFRSGAILALALVSTPLSAFETSYGNEDCNNEASFLEENDIICTAVFSEINVWDFLNSLPRRISFDELVALNPLLVLEDFDTIITGITFVRVQ